MNLLDFTPSLWSALTRTTVQGSVALIAVFTICQLFPRVPAAAKSWLWRLAWLRILLAFATGASLQLALLPAPIPPVRVLSIPGETPVSSLSALESVSVPNPAPISSASFSAIDDLVLIWLVGVLLMIAKIAFDFLASRRLRKTAWHCKEARVVSLLQELARVFKVRSPALLCSARISKPLLTGIVAPAIILPGQMDSIDSGNLELILKHELAHLKRRDLGWNWLGTIARALLWFNPLVWICEREANFAQEVACDELALRDAASRAPEFAALLVEIAVRRERVPQLSTAVSIIRTQSTLERRLKAMKTIQVKRSRSLISIMVAALALTPALVPWRVAAQKPETPSAAETPAGDAAPTDRTPSKPNAEEDLLLQEIKIAQQQLETAKRAHENGAASSEEVAKQQRDLLRLEEEHALLRKDLPGLHDKLQLELKTLEQLQSETRKRIEVGAAPYEDKLKIDREVLKLKRRLASLESDAQSPDKPADATAAAMRYYMSNPELMKRYFPDLYATMAKSGGADLQASNDKPRAAQDVNSQLNRGPRISLKTTQPGVIRLVFVKRGDHVTQGQKLVRLDDSEATIRLKAVQSEFQIADADSLLRKGDLESERDAWAKTHNTSGPEYQDYMKKFELKVRRLDSELALARTKVEQAELNFARLTICAPSDGTVGNLPLAGQTVSPDNELIAFLPDPPREAPGKN